MSPATAQPLAIDDQYMIPGIEILFGNDHMVHLVVGEGFDFRTVDFLIHVAAGTFFGKQHRDPEMDSRKTGDPDS